MLDFLSGFTELPKLDLPSEFWLIATGVLGILLLFWGRHVIRFWLALAGLAGGTYVGMIIVERAELTEPVSWIVVALIALAGAGLLALAYKVCFFIGGFIGGAFLATYLLDIFWPGYPEILVMVIAALVGLSAVFLKDQFTIIATAISGGLLVADSVVSIVYKTEPGDLIRRAQILNFNLTDDLIILASIALLAAVGIYVQRKQRR